MSDIGFYVTDLAGRVLLKDNYPGMAPGSHDILLNASQFSPGVYLYTLNVNGNGVTRKMVITR